MHACIHAHALLCVCVDAHACTCVEVRVQHTANVHIRIKCVHVPYGCSLACAYVSMQSHSQKPYALFCSSDPNPKPNPALP